MDGAADVEPGGFPGAGGEGGKVGGEGAGVVVDGAVGEGEEELFGQVFFGEGDGVAGEGEVVGFGGAVVGDGGHGLSS